MPVAENDKDLYVVPVNEYCLIYSPLRQMSALLNRKAAGQLKRMTENNWKNQETSNKLLQLLKDIRSNPVNLPAVNSGTIDPLFLGIIPTRSCNGACIYCGFWSNDNDQGKFLSFDTAVKAVDWMAETVKRNGKHFLEIHFFGGEPFFAPEIVEVVVHRARLIASQMNLGTHFEVSTNGQFDNSLARFIGDYFNTVILSLDGTEEIHNFHRPLKLNHDSFSRASKNAALLSRTQTTLCLRVCISNFNVGQMEEITHFLCKSYNPCSINFEVLQASKSNTAKRVNPPDPVEFAVNFIRASVVAKEYGIKAVYAAAETDTVRYTFCPVGKDTAIVSPDGRISSCYLLDKQWKERAMNLDIGNIGIKDVTIDKPMLLKIRQLVQDKQRCQNCFCRWTCAGGCHVDNTYPGCSSTYNDFCIQTRIITTCLLLFQLNQEELVFSLLGNVKAMEALAMNTSDKLKDLEN